MSKNTYVELKIVDNDYAWDEDRVRDTYILINPDAEKLEKLREVVDGRFDDEDWIGYESLQSYIENNFEIISISNEIEIEY